VRSLVARVFALLAMVVVTVALLPTGTAQALPPGGCPGGFYSLAVFPGVEYVDENGDGWICGKDLVRSPFGGLLLDNITRR